MRSSRQLGFVVLLGLWFLALGVTTVHAHDGGGHDAGCATCMLATSLVADEGFRPVALPSPQVSESLCVPCEIRCTLAPLAARRFGRAPPVR
jgi:hypothetical protein